ncbi:ATP-grasp domain-containing protein [Ornithinibacillus sp. 4-3]|uniref:ATP-grasp domain-containing protein n=1 Tax=Ornithinibacillus sp. 4-3 TaxID=3231488 RepID=A0AB39HJU4_9BACI
MDTLGGKRLLILGGSRISCEIVRKAKELGIYTMVTDWYPLEQSPAKQLADEYFMTSTADIPAMVNLIKEHKVDGVITGYTDSVLPYYAEMCKQTGLPSYGTREQFEILTNKNKYKKLCREFGVPVVDEYYITETDLETEKINEIHYPVLVKPADGSGARGVLVCNNKDELIEYYKQSLKYSQSKEVLIERYVQGKEVTVFYLLKDGEVYLNGMGNRHVKHNQEGVIPLPVAYTFPSIHLKKYQNEVEPRVKEMFKSLDMKNGMVFMQCIVENGNCLVYDIGYRLTGTLEYKLMEEIYDYNPLEMLIRFALTGKMFTENINNKLEAIWKKYALNVSFLIKPGTIKKINGLKAIKTMPQVIDATLAHVEGDILPETAKGTLKQIVLRVFATAQDQNELAQLLDDIYNKLEVISDKEENMLLDGFDLTELRGVLL